MEPDHSPLHRVPVDARTPIGAYLDGGPLDDTLIVLQGQWEMRVTRFLPLAYRDTIERSVDELAKRPLVWVTGTYRVRTNFAGDPVPASLDSYHFDWIGWDE